MVNVAARLTDKQKKKIIADYTELGSYNATAKIHGISPNTVKNIVNGNADTAKICKQKKEQNTADILSHMESRKDKVCEIIDIGLAVLPQKIELAKSASEVTTAIGTLIDKWAKTGGESADGALIELIKAMKDQ